MWITPLFLPLWCKATRDSFSTRATLRETGNRCFTLSAVAHPMIPPVATLVMSINSQIIGVLKICSGVLLEFNHFTVPKNTQWDRHKTRKALFPQLETTENPSTLEKMGFSLGKNLIVPKRPIKFTKRFFKAKNFVKSEGVPFYREGTVSKKLA